MPSVLPVAAALLAALPIDAAQRPDLHAEDGAIVLRNGEVIASQGAHLEVVVWQPASFPRRDGDPAPAGGGATVGSIIDIPEVAGQLAPRLVADMRAFALEPIDGGFAQRGELGEGLSVDAQWIVDSDRLRVRGTLALDKDGELPVTIRLVLPLEHHDALTWRRTLSSSEHAGPGDELVESFSIGAGATGAHSRHLWAAMTGDFGALGVGISPWEPRVHRLRWDGPRGALVAEVDLAIVPWSREHPGAVPFEFWLFGFDAEFGFRGATQAYYALEPEAFAWRGGRQGQWMPFTQIDTVERPEDFRFVFHEHHPDVSVAYNNANDIWSLVYCEPTVQWVQMPAGTERTWEALSGIIEGLGTIQGSAVRTSGAFADDGRLLHTFARFPWADGARIPVNSSPGVPTTEADPHNAFDLSWKPYADLVARDAALAPASNPERVTGFYLDSLEGWEAPALDYRDETNAHSPWPMTFHPATGRAGQVVLFHNIAFAAEARRRVHANGHLIMANSVLYKFAWGAPVLDVLGIEANWGSGERLAPPPATMLDFIRAMSGQKPYCFLQNVPFESFRGEKVAQYFHRCLHHGFWPGFFSHDAASDPYWENPALYNEDRPLSIQLMDVQGQLTDLGWQPVTLARTSDASLLVERWGGGAFTGSRIGAKHVAFTIHNPTDDPIDATLRVDARLLPDEDYLAWETIDGFELPFDRGAHSVPVQVEPMKTLVVWLTAATQPALQDAIMREEALLAELLERWRRHRMISDEDAAEATKLVAMRGLGATDRAALAQAENLFIGKLEADYRALSATRQLALVKTLRSRIEHPFGGRPSWEVPMTASRGEALRLRLVGDSALVEDPVLSSEWSVSVRAGERELPVARRGAEAVVEAIHLAGLDSVDVIGSALNSSRFTRRRVRLVEPVALRAAPPSITLRGEHAFTVTVANQLGAATTATLSVSGDGAATFEPSAIELDLAPRERRVVTITASPAAIREGGTSAHTLALRAGERLVVSVPLSVTVLSPADSILRESGVVVTVDSSYFGYSPEPLVDGITDTEGVSWSDAAWASDEGLQPHFVAFALPRAETIGEVTLHWAHDGGVDQTSARVLVEGRAGTEPWRVLAYHADPALVPSTTLTFEPATIVELRVLQPTGGGPAHRPGILWLEEVEAR